MKKLALVVVALAVALSVVPAMAGDKSVSGKEPTTFQALSKMPVPERTALTTMTDKELASVEGAFAGCSGFSFCSNYAKVVQANVNALSLGTFQSNYASVYQINN
jgi:hypothetical protein